MEPRKLKASPSSISQPGTGGRLLRIAFRTRKYQLGCLFILLSIVLIQVFFGISALPFVSVSQQGETVLKKLSAWSDKVFQQAVDPTAATNAILASALANYPRTTPAPTCKKWKLVACAMVHQEAAYLMEWIEFHRIQGVEHFVLYTYFSTDLPEYLPMLYENAEIFKMVEVIPARFFSQDPKRKLDTADFLQNREWSMTDCNVRYGKHAQWLLLMDAGHFVHSSQYANISEFIEDQTKEARKNLTDGQELFSAVKIPTVRFGTSGVQDKFQTWLTPNAYTGGADLNYEPTNNTGDQYPLVIETNPSRAPHAELDSHFAAVPVCDESLKSEELQICSDASYVSLIKGGRCPPGPNVDECLRPTENLIWPELGLLRADNHNWRSVKHAISAKYWNVLHNATFEAFDKSWFSSIKDESKFKYIEPIRRAIARVKPRIFLDVNQTCNPEGLKNGQQVMCPKSHPYPFGNRGIRWLKECCEFNKDAGEGPLLIDSNSCFNNSAVICPDPPGVIKWTHRSCCQFSKS